MLENDEYVGKVFGKYKILEVIGKNPKGRILYKAQCIKCGWINEKGMTLDVIKATRPNSICNHKGVVNASNIDHVGKIYGKYKVIACANKRTYKREMLYYVECIKCGYKLPNPKTINEISKTDPDSMCNHKTSDDDKRSIIGSIIGKYEILDYLGSDGHGHSVYKVRCTKCDFIVEKGMILSDIKRYPADSPCRHVFWYSEKLQTTYNHMIARCYNPNEYGYERYGGRGIKVCDEWLRSPWKFNNWALANGYQDGLTLDRIDCNGDYTPDNCRWISLSDNSKWKSTTHYISVNGIVDSAAGWESRLGLYNGAVTKRLSMYGYEETAIWLSQKLYNMQNPSSNKEIICVQIDNDMFNNKEKYRLS